MHWSIIIHGHSESLLNHNVRYRGHCHNEIIIEHNESYVTHSLRVLAMLYKSSCNDEGHVKSYYRR